MDLVLKKPEKNNLKLNKTIIKERPELEEIEITPGIEEQTFNSKNGYGKVTIKGDNDLISDNIKKDIEIFGVLGSYDPASTYNAKISPPNKKTYIVYENISKIKEIDLTGVTDMSNTFRSLNELTEIPPIDTSNVTKMYYTFYNCQKITTIPPINTSNVTDMSSMFYRTGLKTLQELDASKVTSVSNMLMGVSELVEFGGLLNLGKAYTRQSANHTSYKLDVQQSTKLTYNSLLNILNKLYDLNLSYDVANGGTLYRQTVVLGPTNIEKLQATEEGQQAIEIATNKGWDIK